MHFLIEHCPPNPSLEYALKLKSQVPTGTSEIVSIGGGSTIDVAKYIAGELKLPHTAIPTTAGTGSEVTKYVVLTTNGKKKTYTNNKYIPTSYVLDPELVVSLPRLHTLSSGLDTLSQAFESLWSRNATKESRAYSKIAIRLTLKNLKECLDHPENKLARMDMLIAANMSGRAINITKTNVCHAISYPLTDWYGIPHGIACAISLPYFTKKFLKIDISKFMKQLGIPEYSFDMAKVAREVMPSEKLQDCPKRVTHEDLLSYVS